MSEIIAVSSFPDSFEPNGLLLRTDEGKFYLNSSLNEDNPSWTELGGVIPAGIIQDFAGPENNLPVGWLRCNGAEISRATYPALFAAIGTTYGVGDGSSTFGIPDLETDGKFISAADQDADLNVSDGENTHQLTQSELPSHRHSISPNPHSHSYTDPEGSSSGLRYYGTSSSYPSTGNTGSTELTIGNTGSNHQHQNRPLNLKMYKIIKY